MWIASNSDARDPLNALLGVVEQVGKLSRALLKQREGLRGTAQQRLQKAKDALGSMLLLLLGFCTEMCLDAQEVLDEAWAKVKQRDRCRDCRNRTADGLLGQEQANLLDELARLRRALAFYADANNWQREEPYWRENSDTGYRELIQPGPSAVENDKGRQARAALGSLE
jgi:NTP pyrophosphatase (non-canonical NTP hydrolase)